MEFAILKLTIVTNDSDVTKVSADVRWFSPKVKFFPAASRQIPFKWPSRPTISVRWEHDQISTNQRTGYADSRCPVPPPLHKFRYYHGSLSTGAIPAQSTSSGRENYALSDPYHSFRHNPNLFEILCFKILSFCHTKQWETRFKVD